MKFFVDTADIKQIGDLISTGFVDGVTTNPSLIAKQGSDMKEIIKYWDGNQRSYHHTAPINMMYALYQALLDVVEEGLDNILERHHRVHLYLEKGLNDLGLKLLVEKESRLPSLNAVKIPNGVDDLRIRSELLNK